MIRCPDWNALLAHRFDETARQPEDWPQALRHLEECESCRLEAYSADPSLIFLGLPTLEVDDEEVRRMQQAVSTLRQGLELADRDSSWPSGGSRRWQWQKIAASVVVAGGLLAAAFGAIDRLDPGTADPQAAALAAQGGGEDASTLPDGSSVRDSDRSFHATVPASWQDAPVVEEVGGPLTRIYSYPTAPGDKVALVMVIDPALDV